MRVRTSVFILFFLALLSGCTRIPGGASSPAASQPNPYQPMPYVKLKHPDWSKNASIYQINSRQFTPEGNVLRVDSRGMSAEVTR